MPLCTASWSSSCSVATRYRCPVLDGDRGHELQLEPAGSAERLASRGLSRGEILAKILQFTPLLESTSCGNRPVRRANLFSNLALLAQIGILNNFSSPSAHLRFPDHVETRKTHRNIQHSCAGDSVPQHFQPVSTPRRSHRALRIRRVSPAAGSQRAHL